MMGKRSRWKPTAMDLFSGAGGLTVGLKMAGFKVVAAVEIDPAAAATYRENHSSVYLVQQNIEEVSCLSMKRAISIRKGDLDLLAGCPPCQGFSRLRTLNGKRTNRDKRNDLIFEFLRFVKEFLPKTVMLENVPGLAKNARFKRFLREMKELGYLGTFNIMNTVDFGVPQRRKRLIYVAGRRSKVRLAEKDPKTLTVADAIKGMPRPGRSGDPPHDVREHRSERVREIIRHIPKNGGSRDSLPARLRLDCHSRTTGFRDVYGRLAWKKPAPTITSGCFNPSKGRFLHPTQNRTISLREAALIQTFPPNYKFPFANNKQTSALMIGNALPPEFIRRHAVEIKKSLISSVGSRRE